MAHVPHLYLPGPWSTDAIVLPSEQIHHLRGVLRVRDGEPCTYTDGEGRVGEGLLADDRIVRGVERDVAAPPAVTLAVAPPANKDRQRVLVEKAAELGARRVVWLATSYGQGRPPRADKATQWAVGALEQSRGAHLTDVDDRMTRIDELGGPLVAADQGGSGTVPSAPVTLLVGPEGGWAPDEIPAGTPLVDLGDRVLRTETAAIVGLFLLLRAAPGSDGEL